MSSEKQTMQRLWLILKQYPEIFLEEVRASATSLIHNNRPLIVAVINSTACIISRGLPVRLREFVCRAADCQLMLTSAFGKINVNMLILPST
jgi:hypothetical protein